MGSKPVNRQSLLAVTCVLPKFLRKYVGEIVSGRFSIVFRTPITFLFTFEYN